MATTSTGLTPEYLASLIEADVPAEAIAAGALLSTQTLSVPEIGTMQLVRDTVRKNKTLRYSLVIGGGLVLVLVFGGVAYYMHNQGKKKERERRLMAYANKRRNDNMTSGTRQITKDEDSNTYERAFIQSTYGVL